MSKTLSQIRAELCALIDMHKLKRTDVVGILKNPDLKFPIKKPGKSFDEVKEAIIASGQGEDVLQLMLKAINDGNIKHEVKKRVKRPNEEEAHGDNDDEEENDDDEIIEKLKINLALRGKIVTGDIRKLTLRLLRALEDE